MNNLIIRILPAFLLMVCASSASADREIRYQPGVGTYGVNTEKYECPRCGKVLTKGSGHACVVETSERSSSRSSGGYEASDAEGDAIIDSDPDLLINNSYVRPVDLGTAPQETASEDEAEEATEASDSDGDSDWEAILGLAALAGLFIWFFKS